MQAGTASVISLTAGGSKFTAGRGKYEKYTRNGFFLLFLSVKFDSPYNDKTNAVKSCMCTLSNQMF